MKDQESQKIQIQNVEPQPYLGRGPLTLAEVQGHRPAYGTLSTRSNPGGTNSYGYDAYGQLRKFFKSLFQHYRLLNGGDPMKAEAK